MAGNVRTTRIGNRTLTPESPMMGYGYDPRLSEGSLTESLASHPASMTHLSVPAERKQQLGITENLVRVSIGIENPDDLIADFTQALAAV